MNAAALSGPPLGEAVATRVLSPGSGEALRRFEDPALLAAGRVNLISLDALAEAFGTRWPSQAARVETFLGRLLAGALRPGEAFLQLAPTDILISHPDRDREAAQVACLRYLRELQQHFLRTSAKAPHGLYQVAVVASGRVEARPIDPNGLLELERAAEVEGERASALARATEPFIASHGRRIRVACRLEPLLNLSTGAAIGLRLAQQVYSARDEALIAPSALAEFAGVDRQRVDAAAIIHGLAQLRERAEPPPALIISMSYASLSSQRGRTEMLALLREARRRASLGVICEVSGIEGAPHAQLQEAVALIRPLALFVVGKVDVESQVVWSHLRGAGLRGIAFDCPDFEGGAVLLGWARAAAQKARRVASSVLLYGVPSMDYAARLSQSGATHATAGA